MNKKRVTEVCLVGKDGTRDTYELDPDHYSGLSVEWKDFVENINYVEITTKCQKCGQENESILEEINDGGSQERPMGLDSNITISGDGLECETCGSTYDVSVTLSYYAGCIIFIPDNTFNCEYSV